jgi:hypothetical protein
MIKKIWLSILVGFCGVVGAQTIQPYQGGLELPMYISGGAKLAFGENSILAKVAGSFTDIPSHVVLQYDPASNTAKSTANGSGSISKSIIQIERSVDVSTSVGIGGTEAGSTMGTSVVESTDNKVSWEVVTTPDGFIDIELTVSATADGQTLTSTCVIKTPFSTAFLKSLWDKWVQQQVQQQMSSFHAYYYGYATSSYYYQIYGTVIPAANWRTIPRGTVTTGPAIVTGTF